MCNFPCRETDPGFIKVGHGVIKNGERIRLSAKNPTYRLWPVLTSVLAFALTGCNTVTQTNTPAPTPAPAPTDPDQRADLLIAQMTQPQKLQLVHGNLPLPPYPTPPPRNAVYWVPGIPSLGIPDLLSADGPAGLGDNVGPATALPSPLASAASWDLTEAYKYGQVIGLETSAYGLNVNLGGNVNLTGREPRDGRTFETGGEDPYLSGEINAKHLTAIQNQYVIAGVKHFAFNDQETARSQANAIIDERSARESDLLAFEVALKDSNAQMAMCAYSLVNGIFNCQNDHLLNNVLKGEYRIRRFRAFRRLRYPKFSCLRDGGVGPGTVVRILLQWYLDSRKSRTSPGER